MFHVHCKLANASALISGIAFRQHEAGHMVTESPVAKEVADLFAGIPGYEVVDADENTASQGGDGAPGADAKKPAGPKAERQNKPRGPRAKKTETTTQPAPDGAEPEADPAEETEQATENDGADDNGGEGTNSGEPNAE